MKNAFDQGRAAACARFGIKLARGSMPGTHPRMPARPGVMSAPSTRPVEPQPQVSWDAFRQGAQKHVEQGASGIGNMHSAPPPPPAARSATPAAAAPAAGGAASRFKLPSVGWKGTLGLMGAGALGAGMLGMHRQNQRDTERERLVYAPMQGGFQ